jgi:phosphatidylglycerophosphate synthase
MRLLTLPNCLSISRVVLTAPTVWVLLHDHAALTIGLFGIVIASDLMDGRIARQRHQVSSIGTLLDHGSDAIFVVTLCAAGAWLDLLPIALPVLMACAFMQYALDSRSVGGRPRGSSLGRWNGIAYFVIVGLLIAVHHLAANAILNRALYGLGWLLAASTMLSIVLRTLHLPRSR